MSFDRELTCGQCDDSSSSKGTWPIRIRTMRTGSVICSMRFPDPSRAVAFKDRIGGDDGQIAAKGLSGKHPIERVAMVKRETLDAFQIAQRNRQQLDAVQW